jgi:alcohol dehydrogenase
VTGVVGANGGFAERLVVRTTQVIRVPEALPNLAAASLVDAGATAANCVRASSGSAASITVVLGGGPVGFLAAELLRMDGRPILVVESNDRRRDALSRLGHDVVERADALDVRPGNVIDAAGDPSLVRWALDALEPQGKYVLAGYGTVDSLDFAPAARKELRVLGVRSGRREDLERVMLLASREQIHVPEAQCWALGDVDDALRALRAGEVAGKAVIDSGA